MQVRNFVNKIKWKAFFNTEVKNIKNVEKEERRIIKNILHRSTPRCNETLVPEIEAWLAGLQSALLSAMDKGLRKAKYFTPEARWCNHPALTTWAWKFMKERNWTALPNDKEPGFTIVKKDELKKMILEKFESEKYEEVSTLSTSLTMMKDEYVSLCRRIARLEGAPREAVRMGSSALVPAARFDTVFQATLKTHKPQGQVRIRPIHAGSRHTAAGVSMWLSDQLQSVLNELPHFVIDSNAFCQRVQRLRGLGPEFRMVRVDLKDFFLSGTPEQLATHCGEAFEVGSERRRAIEDAIVWLCREQFVTCKLWENRRWRVCRGSGMGLRHSGAFADMALYRIAEADLLQPHVLASFSIVDYIRFRDDIWFCGTKAAGIR